MTQFIVSDKNTDVSGETVLSFIDGMGAFKEKALGILSSNNINNPQKGEWYKLQHFLDALKVIADTIGPNTLFQIGKKINENVKMPQNTGNVVPNFERVFERINDGFQINHRKGHPGNYLYEKINENSSKLTTDTAYPCDFERGLVEGFAKRYKPDNAIFVKLTHDENQCRKNGSNKCTYIISW